MLIGGLLNGDELGRQLDVGRHIAKHRRDLRRLVVGEPAPNWSELKYQARILPGKGDKASGMPRDFRQRQHLKVMALGGDRVTIAGEAYALTWLSTTMLPRPKCGPFTMAPGEI